MKRARLIFSLMTAWTVLIGSVSGVPGQKKQGRLELRLRHAIHAKSQALGLAFSPNGMQLAAGIGDKSEPPLGEIMLINPLTGKVDRILKDDIGVFAVCYSPDGKRLATGNCDASVKIWEPETGVQLDTYKVEPSMDIWTLSFSPDGKRLAAGWDIHCTVWNLRTRRVLFTRESLWAEMTLFHPSGNSLVSIGTPRNLVETLDAETGEVRSRLRTGNANLLSTLALTADGEILATVDDERVLKIWSLKTGEQKKTFPLQFGDIDSMAFFPDGRHLAITGLARRNHHEGIFVVVDIVTGEEKARVDKIHDGVCSVAISPDGKLLAVGERNDRIEIFDVIKH